MSKLVLFLMYTFMSGNWLLEEFIVEPQWVLLRQVVIAFTFMWLNNVGLCSTGVELDLILLRRIMFLQLLLVLCYGIFLFD